MRRVFHVRLRVLLMRYKEIFFSSHAIQSMFDRGINTEDVLPIIRDGEVIADYPDEKPFPSCLVLGASGRRPLHLVLAVDSDDARCFVITVYDPDPALWSADFRTRRKP